METIPLRMLRERDGGSVSSVVAPRTQGERALLVVQGADITGVSTRRVDERVKALGWRASARARLAGSASDWTPLHHGLARRLGGVYGSRRHGRGGARRDGGGLGGDIGPSEGRAFWRRVLRARVAGTGRGGDSIAWPAERTMPTPYNRVARCERASGLAATARSAPMTWHAGEGRVRRTWT